MLVDMDKQLGRLQQQTDMDDKEPYGDQIDLANASVYEKYTKKNSSAVRLHVIYSNLNNYSITIYQRKSQDLSINQMKKITLSNKKFS